MRKYESGGVTLCQGDCLEVLPSLPAASFDAVITDPPYSSGGLFRGDRQRPTTEKYQQSGQRLRWDDFSGDNRDQRSWVAWCNLWLSQCRRLLKPGGYCLAFTDWRQLPSLTDAVQCAGLLWRGVVAWDKGPAARAPRRGYFKQQCEFLVWATSGPLCDPPEASCFGHLPGCYAVPVERPGVAKLHLCGKPLDLMRQLVRCAPPGGGLVLDPFSGSGTTALACLLEGRSCVGVELSEAYHEVACRRLAEAQHNEVEGGLPFRPAASQACLPLLAGHEEEEGATP